MAGTFTDNIYSSRVQIAAVCKTFGFANEALKRFRKEIDIDVMTKRICTQESLSPICNLSAAPLRFQLQK